MTDVATLREWHDRIYADVQRLLLDCQYFWGLQSILENNSRIRQAPGDFLRWAADNFIVAAAVQVRRQVDRHKHSVSMIRFLEELKTQPALISRNYYRQLATSTDLPEGWMDRGYYSLVGAGRDQLDPETIQNEIKELEGKSEGIRHMVNKKFAHADEHGPVLQAKFMELEEVCSYLEKLVLRYHLLLTGRTLCSLLPTFQYDWQKIFHFPWIEVTRGRAKRQ
jgi:hypothetical protein